MLEENPLRSFELVLENLAGGFELLSKLSKMIISLLNGSSDFFFFSRRGFSEGRMALH